MPPRKKKAVPESTGTVVEAELPNALRRPVSKGFARDSKPKFDMQAVPSAEAVRQVGELRAAAIDDIASGRGLTYEWEFVAAQIIDRVQVVEDASGTGGSTGGLRYTHNQSLPSASWSISHGLATKPGVVLVANDGQELFAEVHYPDDNHLVIVFGVPYAGTAYLRG